MPQKPIIGLNKIDVNRPVAIIEDIRKVIPHRHEFEMLSSILYLDTDKQVVAACKDITTDDFWVRGHMPGRPLMPGVLIVEAAAQMTCYYRMKTGDNGQLIGFARVEDVRFRRQVVPPCKLILMAKLTSMSHRHISTYTQAFVDGRMVYDGSITGMALPED